MQFLLFPFGVSFAGCCGFFHRINGISKFTTDDWDLSRHHGMLTNKVVLVRDAFGLLAGSRRFNWG